jgi:diacylglycerol kinase (ATP)
MIAMRAGLIVNPKAGKSSGKGTALAARLRSSPEVSVKLIDRFEELPRLVDDCARDGVTDLFISSGDGTIHAIMTELAERRPFANLPRLCLLPHGTTNLTAADLGFRHRDVDAQASFIATLQPTDLRQRPTLRVVNPKDGRPRHGMFLGTGAVSEATLYCQRAFNAKGVKGSWATFATLASTVGRSMFTAPNPDDLTRVDRPFPISLSADGKPICQGNQLLLLATTLEKLILGTKPFWGGHTAPLRATVVPYPVPNLARWLLPIMFGKEDRRVPQGTVSVCGKVLEVASTGSFVIDGEFFDAPAEAPLRIETGPTFSFICG